MWPIPVYCVVPVVDFVIPICHRRARWLDYLPHVWVQWYADDVRNLKPEILHDVFCELQRMKGKGRSIPEFR